MSSDTFNDTSFVFTKARIIIPMVTGSISFLSSLVIISIVLRSMNGLKTAYHRIVLGLSFADCLTSFMIALTTIPMPKDVIYPFGMPSYGNIATCEAQGFIYMLGNGLVLDMNAILNIYYLCTLRYNMPEKTFRCYLEIPLYIVALAASSTVTYLLLLKEELMNPSPTAPYCVPSTYPLDCTKADNPECRDEGGREAWYLVTTVGIGLAFSTLMITMALIVHSSYRNERKLRKDVKDNQIEGGDETCQDLQYTQQAAGIITRQSLLYIAAFLITWVFALVQFSVLTEPNDTVLVLRMIFQPLQGFFNLLIFVYHKVYMILRSDADLAIAEALGIVFLHPDKMKDSVLQVDNLVFVVEDVLNAGGFIPQNNVVDTGGRSDDLSGFEDIILDADRGVQFESEKSIKVVESSVFVRSKGLSSIGERRSIAYKYYASGDEEEGDLSITSKKVNLQGLAFSTKKTVKKPSEGTKVTKQALNSNDSTNLSYSEGQSVISGGSMLEEDSRLSYARTGSAPDSHLESTMAHIQQASRNKMVTRGDDGSLLDWSVNRAESFAEDSSADLRYAKMKKFIDAKSRGNNAIISNGGNRRRWSFLVREG